MTDNELLLSISNIMDKKIKPLEKRMDSFDTRLNEVINDINEIKIDIIEMKSDIVEMKKDIDHMKEDIDHMKEDIDHMKEDIRNINLKLENIIEPRLDHIEECYLTTFERYKIEVDKFEKIETDISVLQSVVTEHGQRLQAQGA